MCCREGNVDVACLTNGLAVVHRLQRSELAGTFLESTCDAEQVLSALECRQRGPDTIKGGAGSADGSVDLGLPCSSDLGQRFAGRGTPHGEVGVGRAIHKGTVDEVAVARFDLNGMRLEGRGQFEGTGQLKFWRGVSWGAHEGSKYLVDGKGSWRGVNALICPDDLAEEVVDEGARAKAE